MVNVNKNNIVEVETCETRGNVKLKSELRRVHQEIHRKSAKQQSLEILCNPCFILVLVNIFLFLFGCSVVFTHIIAFAESQGISSSLGRVLVSILGGAGIAGRLGLSTLSQMPCTNTFVIYIAAVSLTGKPLVSFSELKFRHNACNLVADPGFLHPKRCGCQLYYGKNFPKTA